MSFLRHLVLAFADGVWLGGEPSDAFFVPEDGQRVARGYQNVESQVKLETVEQVRIWHISLHHIIQLLIIFRSIKVI